MKTFITIIIMAGLVGFLAVKTNFMAFNREDYLSNKVVDLSVPFDVRIDVQLLKSLEQPADESSRSSTEGL